MSSRRPSQESPHEEAASRLSGISKMIYYTSKFAHNDDETHSTLNTPVRRQPSTMKFDRRKSVIDVAERFVSF